MRRTLESNKTQKAEIRDKKDFKLEQAGIRLFTLMFDNPEIEAQWNMAHLNRHISLTSRYLFVAACFQGLFYCGDLVELHAGISAKSVMDSSSNLLHVGLIRLLLGILTLLSCFLVSTGLIVPTQFTIWWLNICYGIPTLSLFYFARATPSHWDCLFLIYGLCFFMLPKISPLNFVFGFSGGAVLSTIFIFISSYRLNVQQWLISTTVLLMMTALFSYMCYCSEKVSREKWMLRERLRQEKINLRIVSSSFQDDINRTVNDERPFPLDNTYITHDLTSVTPLSDRHPLSFMSKAILGFRDRGKGRDKGNDGVMLHTMEGRQEVNLDHAVTPLSESALSASRSSLALALAPTHPQTEADCIPAGVSAKEKRMALFYKGIVAWALCYVMAYTFDTEEVNRSAAFALLMHSMGFSTFLVVVTGQIRWLAMNGVVGLTMLWAFNQAGIEQKWVVFSTHSVGYIIMAVVIVVMILVFGGVVFVWTHLIDFVKDILIRYPQVKLDLSEDKVLEQVLMRYLSDIPKTVWSGGDFNHVLEVYKEEGDDEERATAKEASTMPAAAVAPCRPFKSKVKGNSSKSTALPLSATPSSSSKASASDHSRHAHVLTAKRPGSCYFCLKSDSDVLVPACRAWDNRKKAEEGEGLLEGESKLNGISMCTPYTEMVMVRDKALEEQESLTSTLQAREGELHRMSQERDEAVRSIQRLNKRISDLEVGWKQAVLDAEEAVLAEKRRREEDVQRIIGDHNKQLSEVKRLYKTMKQQSEKKVRSAEPAAVVTEASVDRSRPAASASAPTLSAKASSSQEKRTPREESAAAHSSGRLQPIASAPHSAATESARTGLTRATVPQHPTPLPAASVAPLTSMVQAEPMQQQQQNQQSPGDWLSLPSWSRDASSAVLLPPNPSSGATAEAVDRFHSHASTVVGSSRYTFDNGNDEDATDAYDMSLNSHLLEALESLLAGSLSDE